MTPGQPDTQKPEPQFVGAADAAEYAKEQAEYAKEQRMNATHEMVKEAAKEQVKAKEGEVLPPPIFTETHHREHPETWWDAFKAQYFPARLRRRFPVVWEVFTIKIFRLRVNNAIVDVQVRGGRVSDV